MRFCYGRRHLPLTGTKRADKLRAAHGEGRVAGSRGTANSREEAGALGHTAAIKEMNSVDSLDELGDKGPLLEPPGGGSPAGTVVAFRWGSEHDPPRSRPMDTEAPEACGRRAPLDLR